VAVLRPRCCHRLGTWLRSGLLLGLSACSRSEWQEPEPDPDLVAADRERQAQIAAQARDTAAADAEREQLVLALLSEPVEPARSLEVSEFYAVLGYYCGQCHPTDPDFVRPPSWDGLYMGDLNELIQIGKITPGDGEASRVVSRIRSGDMPPVSATGPRLPPAMIERIVQFIDNLPTTQLPENAEQR